VLLTNKVILVPGNDMAYLISVCHDCWSYIICRICLIPL